MKHFLSVILYVYMFFNVLSDWKRLKTKNEWHFLMFGIGILLSVITHSFFQSLLVILISLIVGLIRQRFEGISAGDTKMLVVVSLFLFLLHPFFNLYLLPLVVHVFYFVFSHLQTFLFFLLSIVKQEFRLGQYYAKRQGNRFIYRSPEALPIFLTICLFEILF